MAKTKAELQDELIGLRNKNNKLVAAMDRMNDDWGKKYIAIGEQKQKIENSLRESNNKIIDLEETVHDFKNFHKYAMKDKNNLERLKTAHIKLGEALREAKDQLKIQEEVTVEMVKQFDNVLMERHEKIKSLKSQNNNLRQTLKDTL